MPTATKRRKLSHVPSSLPKSRAINTFTKVSKGSNIAKTIIQKNDDLNTIAITETLNDNKRKGAPTEEGNEAVSAPFSAEIVQRPTKPLPQRPSNSTKPIPKTPQKSILYQLKHRPREPAASLTSSASLRKLQPGRHLVSTVPVQEFSSRHLKNSISKLPKVCQPN
jgi:hypothetical protein